jgi:hypothetical protein
MRAGFVQEHRGDQLGALELGVAFLQVGLPLVVDQQVRLGQVAVVADQREDAVGGGVAGDLVLVDGVVDAVVAAADLAVAGVGSGTAAVLLPEPLADLFGDADADPADGAGALERVGGGLLDRDRGLDPGLGGGQLLVELIQRCDATGDAIGPGVGVVVDLG